MDEKTLEAQAGALIAAHKHRAMQLVVDDIQHAVRLGNDETAEEFQRLLRRIERELGR